MLAKFGLMKSAVTSMEMPGTAACGRPMSGTCETFKSTFLFTHVVPSGNLSYKNKSLQGTTLVMFMAAWAGTENNWK